MTPDHTPRPDDTQDPRPTPLPLSGEGPFAHLINRPVDAREVQRLKDEFAAKMVESAKRWPRKRARRRGQPKKT